MRLLENGKRQRIGIRTGYLVYIYAPRVHYNSWLVQDDFNNNRIFDVETDLMNNNINLTEEIFMNREFAETWFQTLKTIWLTGGGA